MRRVGSVTISLTHDVPPQLVAGDSLEFLVAIPSELTGWSGSARLTGPAQMDATSVAVEGLDYHVKFSGQAAGTTGTYKTAQLCAGQYMLTVWATNGTDRYTVLQRPLTVTPDLSTAAPQQRHAVEMLPIIERAIKARVSGNDDGGLEQYTIDSTSVTKIPMSELQRLRARYTSEVAAIQNPGSPIPQVKFAFTPAGAPFDLRRRFG